MKIVIQQYQQEDEEQLKRLIRFSYEEYSLLNILKSKNLIEAFSAYDGERMVGAVIAWKSNFHPYCTYFRTLIDPFSQNDIVLEGMLVELAGVGELPHQTSIWEMNIGLKRFYEKNGFHSIRRTYMPTLSLSRFGVDELASVGAISQKKDRIKTVTDILEDEQLKGDLIVLAKDVYKQTHEDNPVAEMSRLKWESLVFADDIIADGSLICLDSNEKIVAFSMLYESEEERTVELGWCGSINKETLTLVPDLALQQIKYAQSKGFQHIQGEFDTTSDYAMEVLRKVPFPPSPSWITYQK